MKTDYTVVARKIMEDMQYDNGYGHVEGISFPAVWVKKIAAAVQKFLDANPGLLTDEFIDEMSGGDVDEREDKYGKLQEYRALDSVLGDYFDNGMSTGVVEVKPRLMHTYKRVKK